MNLRRGLCSGVVTGLLFLACGPKVTIPPTVDLRKYDRVGLVGFDCNVEENMDEFVTRWVLMTIRSYQKEARIIELGSKQEVLQSLQKDSINSEAIQAIGQKYNVNAIITGSMEVTEIWPLEVPFPHWLLREARPTGSETSIEGKRVKAMVKAWITARLWKTQHGGTIWRTSAHGEEMVRQVSAISDGKIIFDAQDPRKAYWDLVNPLVKKICTDFKIKRVRIEVN